MYSKSIPFHFTYQEDEGSPIFALEIEGLPGLIVEGASPAHCLQNLGSALIHYRLQFEELQPEHFTKGLDKKDVPPLPDQLSLVRYLTNSNGEINTYLENGYCIATLPSASGKWEIHEFTIPRDPEDLQPLRDFSKDVKEDDDDDENFGVAV